MAEIVTFRPSLQDKVAIGRILREHPYLNRNVSAAIRAGLTAYHELQVLREEQARQQAAHALAQELAQRYQAMRWIEGGAAQGEAALFEAWLAERRSPPPPQALGAALLEGRLPAATSHDPDGKLLVDWYAFDRLVIGRAQTPAPVWYVVTLAQSAGMPAIESYQIQ
ncbi:MAG: hypothetical protein AB1894_17540 [Chloroflexota bacterium]